MKGRFLGFERRAALIQMNLPMGTGVQDALSAAASAAKFSHLVCVNNRRRCDPRRLANGRNVAGGRCSSSRTSRD